MHFTLIKNLTLKVSCQGDLISQIKKLRKQLISVIKFSSREEINSKLLAEIYRWKEWR